MKTTDGGTTNELSAQQRSKADRQIAALRVFESGTNETE
jgi:hypothetical protein